MSVVVTPESRSLALDALDVVAVVTDPVASVPAWREAEADAILVDSTDESLAEAIRETPDGDAVPIVVIGAEEQSSGPADALLDPDADAEAAQNAIERAQAACEYRLAVTDLYEACRERSAGQPETSIRDLRAAADDAYEELDELPPSAFHNSTDDEQ